MNTQESTEKKYRISRGRNRHHPLIVTLHWLIVLIVLAEALIGVGILHFWPNTEVKIAPLRVHMVLGLTLLALVIVQIVARLSTTGVRRATAGNEFLDFVGKATHGLLYAFTLLMAGSGILLAAQSKVLPVIAAGSVTLPMSFEPFLHAVIFVMFGMLVALHVTAAFYHQVILKDELLKRMWYSRRRGSTRASRASDVTLGDYVERFR